MKQAIDYETYRDTSMTWGDYTYLSKWCKEKKYNPSELTIGQMVEFLYDHSENDLRIEIGSTPMVIQCNELCNHLWKLVVERCKNRTEKL